MPNLFRCKTLFTAAIAVCLLLLLLFFFALRSAPVSRTAELRIADTPQLSNGVLVVSVVLSNGTPRSLNIVDDTAGNPLFALDAGAAYWPAGNRDHGAWLGPIGNTLKLNLAPGASLTNSVSVTNPPPRFRFRATTRDFAAERRGMWVKLLALPQRWSENFLSRLQLAKPPQEPMPVEKPMPTSDWIEVTMPDTRQS